MATDQTRLAELNMDRYENEDEEPEITTNPEYGPNIGLYMILGIVAVMGDLVGLIPVLGALLRLPFAGIIWLWRLMSGNFKTSPTQKVITNALLGATPLPSNTTFIASCYLEETKLGKTIMEKGTKLAKLIK
jgi:hypothetical protein